MKIVIAPDSFKGSLSSKEICEVLEAELSRLLPEAEIVSIPVADGGEGTLEAFNASKPGQIIYAKATDPWFNELEAPYLFYGSPCLAGHDDGSLAGHDDGSLAGRECSVPTAVIETARVAGFIKPSRETCSAAAPVRAPDPTITTTYGLGMLIKDALARGARKIIIGLGGSCTNDGGCGMAAALGTKFYGIPDSSDCSVKQVRHIERTQPGSAEILPGALPAAAANHSTTSTACSASGGSPCRDFIPTGGTLSEIVHIDNSESIRLLGGNRGNYLGKSIDITGMCDVTNPLCGENGAAHVFAPQKGASDEDVDLLDRGLMHLVSLMDDIQTVHTGESGFMKSLPTDRNHDGQAMFPGEFSAVALSAMPGSGAAGGLGFGIRAFAGGRLQRGIDLMLDTVDFDRHLWNADFVITGEGRFDSQSSGGKAVSGICQRAAAENVPVIILCGTADDNAKSALQDDTESSTRVIETGAIDFAELTLEQIRAQAIKNLHNAILRLAEILTCP